jgi:hypothetical protein
VAGQSETEVGERREISTVKDRLWRELRATLLPVNYVYVGELRNLARKNRIIKKAVEREFESGGDIEGVLLT